MESCPLQGHKAQGTETEAQRHRDTGAHTPTAQTFKTIIFVDAKRGADPTILYNMRHESFKSIV